VCIKNNIESKKFILRHFLQDILEMMEHIDDDEYFQRQLEAKSCQKRKQELLSSSLTAVEGQTKKQRSVDDYCDDSNLNK
jgi:hypothetical protein